MGILANPCDSSSLETEPHLSEAAGAFRVRKSATLSRHSCCRPELTLSPDPGGSMRNVRQNSQVRQLVLRLCDWMFTC